MSLFGAMDTAVSGLSAQSSAITNISNNVANAQTVGYKSVGTAFVDYLTVSTPTENGPDSVVANPEYNNTVQGTITQSTDPLALAINGAGFFAVAESDGTTTSGQPVFSQQPYYTRAGDFTMNANGYLVNSAGEYLEAWPVDSTTGAVNETALAPVQVSQTAFAPIPTANVTLAANLPLNAPAGTPMATQITVYDAAGATHTLTFNWTQPSSPGNPWTLSVSADGNPPFATATVGFNSNGTIASINGAGTAGQPANLTLTPNLGTGPQPITLNLGTFGQSNGVTQFAGTSYNLVSVTQDGVPPGSFTSVSINTAGQIITNYSNGQTRVIAQIPLVTFNNPNALQRQNGQAYLDTAQAGAAKFSNPNANGAGGLVTGAVESSNVDIATEFTNLIIAQQAYSANAKTITATDSLMQTTINLIQ
ncbi:MAG: flagellar hook protein FlgE [Acidobacteriia bacterium]|nr:flagellar hook protein FlgE [Methyloceanibacter sp.]MCL6492501.1 flagellar hook protein FlgE [Terriglobia bacterium]